MNTPIVTEDVEKEIENILSRAIGADVMSRSSVVSHYQKDVYYLVLIITMLGHQNSN